MILHFDLTRGASGDMLCAAMLATGASLKNLQRQLALLPIEGYTVRTENAVVGKMGCLRFIVKETQKQNLRTYARIRSAIEKSRLDEEVKRTALKALLLLAEAEAQVHDVRAEDVHFHEIGAVDTIVDIVSAAVLLREIAPSKITATPVCLGSGTVSFSHGTFSVPAPAARVLSSGIPTFPGAWKTELATPTGLAIVRAVVQKFTENAQGKPVRQGYGCGSRSSSALPTYVAAIVCRAGV